MNQPSLFSRQAWSGIAACCVVLAALPLLNLAFTEGHPLHVPSYMVSLVGKFMCYALAALALDLVWGYGVGLDLTRRDPKTRQVLDLVRDLGYLVRTGVADHDLVAAVEQTLEEIDDSRRAFDLGEDVKRFTHDGDPRLAAHVRNARRAPSSTKSFSG